MSGLSRRLKQLFDEKLLALGEETDAARGA